MPSSRHSGGDAIVIVSAMCGGIWCSATSASLAARMITKPASAPSSRRRPSAPA